MSEVNQQPAAGSAPATPPPAAPVTPQATVTPPTVDNKIPTPAPVTPPVEAPKIEVKNEVTPPPAKIVPEKYDIKLPDGSPLDASAIDRVSQAAKAKGLSNDEAQALLTGEHQTAANYVQSLQSKMAERQVQWQSEVKSDPEMGGANYDKSVQNAQRGLNKYATPAFIKELNDTGLGNHPEMVRIFARIGAANADDKAVMPSVNDTPPKKDPLAIWYPSSVQK